MSIPPSAKYEIIREMTLRDNNLLNICQLCEAAGVSRSGYYHYLNTEDVRLRRDAQDRADFEIILMIFTVPFLTGQIITTTTGINGIWLSWHPASITDI